MPELPDIEINRRYFLATALHQPIDHVHVGDKKDWNILDGIDPQQFGKELKGYEFKKVTRHGNYLFPELSSGSYLVFHFGMSGFLTYFKQPPDNFSDMSVCFAFNNGYNLAMFNRCCTGMVAWVSDPRTFIREKGLGPDALDGVRDENFRELIGRGNVMIKALLLDQHNLSGIGNIYADEILFQAHIHPTTPANLLTRMEGRRLAETLPKVLNEGVQANADLNRLPDTFLSAIRKEGASCPRCGAAIQKMKVRGRVTFFCPVCQKP